MHAHLTRERKQWLIRTLGDTPGLLRDGIRCDAFSLEPGVEIGVGDATLVAESEPWIALRSFCSRILGWGRDRMVLVDHALRSIRMSMTYRAPLHLYADFDLVPLAQSLHRRTIGAERPFVLCDPHRHDGTGSVRSAKNYKTGMAAATVAAGGSLCVRGERLPRDFSFVLARLREPGVRIQLIVCSNKHDGKAVLRAPIHVPSLKEHTEELPRIVDEYTHDAITALNVPMASPMRIEHGFSHIPRQRYRRSKRQPCG